MIESLQVVDAKRASVEWWPKVQRLKRRKQIKFKPGLNILWGPNGCGKTTILLAMARMLHCWQGGVSTLTEHSIRELFKLRFGSNLKSEDKYLNGVMPVHDGQAVFFVDPSKGVGASRSFFDNDFSFEQLMDMRDRGSSGQKTTMRLMPLIRLARGEEPPPVRCNINREYVNDLWISYLDRVEETMRGTIPRGQPTVLLDEPDRSLDIPSQVGLWKILKMARKSVQIIVATHSILALDIPDAHYIDLHRGYLKKCREAAQGLLGSSKDPKED